MTKKKITSIIPHLLLAGTAMVSLFLTGRCALAANRIPEDNIVIDYANQSLDVTTMDAEVMVSFPTVKVVDGQITKVQAKKWDVYDGNYMQEEQEDGSRTVTVDLSLINNKKGGYVAVKTDATSEAYLIHFGGVHTKLSASYDNEEGKVLIIDRADEGNECESAFEYRTQSGNWRDYDSETTQLRHYEQQGATLYFREKCGYDDGDEYISRGRLSARAIADKIGTVSDGSDYVLYEAVNTFTGVELKVKITKLRNGPTAAFNYAKRTITVRKNTEYRMDASDDFQQVTEENTETVDIGEEAGIFEVRSIEAFGKKYTPPSKITHYDYPATRILAITEDESGFVGKKAGRLSLLYNEKTNKINCSSTDLVNTYLIYVAKADEEEPQAGSKAVATVKTAVSTSTPSIVTLPLSKFPVGSSVYVAYAADAKNGKWATEPVLLGVVQ